MKYMNNFWYIRVAAQCFTHFIIAHLLEGVTIYVASDIFSTNQQLCGAGPVTLDEAEMDRHVIRICDNAPGKYVFLVKRAPDLKLCDVEVFGYREGTWNIQTYLT